MSDRDPALAERLRDNIAGDVLFDAFSRGRYSTDASIYQITPLGVVVPKTEQDVVAALAIARDAGVPVTARGGGTSQCGQTVNESLIVDLSKHLNRIVSVDAANRRAVVQPGLVLDRLNAALAGHDLWFPVDVSTASRATLGGMAGNNSCGSRSIEYGTMRDNVLAVDAWLADGSEARFGELDVAQTRSNAPNAVADLTRDLLALGRREAGEIERRFPKLMRRVGGYNIDALVPDDRDRVNLAHLLVGSEGTLAFSREITLKLSPRPAHKVLGVCHFPSFYQAMDATQHIVALRPQAVELVDRTIIELSQQIPMFRATMQEVLRGEPAALLLVEFAGEDRAEQFAKLRQLNELMADLGFAGGVVDAVEPGFQKAIWEVRKSGLNIVMSMKSEGKPVSFIEDCAVQLSDLADYTERLTQVFHKYGTTGTWYAHASVGTLHVRPVLNLKLDEDVKKLRAIAEEAFELVREYKGSHSGEHGDGIVRSEFHQPMFGRRMVDNFAEVKDRFDPQGLFNPRKIVRPPKMDDRSLFRFKPGYKTIPIATALDWSDWGGFAGAVEMCNNNGACRKFDAGVMCPSYRVSGDEKHLTRGRANALRLALSGQLGSSDAAPDAAFTSGHMKDAMSLCVSCKGCKRECPTGVDMARMKIEFQHHYRRRHGLSMRDRLVGYLPYYAPWLAPLAPLANLRNRVPGLKRLLEPLTGLSAERDLPSWRRDRFAPTGDAIGPVDGTPVALLADTFNRYFEPENLHAALTVLTAAGYRVYLPTPADGSRRPLCCGRTLLSVGLVEHARDELRRSLDALRPLVEQGMPIIGLEPSCLLTLRDELQALLPGDAAAALGERALLIEEFLVREADAGALNLPLKPLRRRALLHGHCHQKAFGALGAVERCLAMVPELDVETIESSCCGMAGAFGYQRETQQASRAMAELSLLPALRDAGDALVVADGTSCRHQIAFGVDRDAVHVVRVLADALDADGATAAV